MSSDRDDVEEAILKLLQDGPMSYTALLESLDSRGVGITRPKLSRRLKNLVKSETISRETVSGWPPTTRYKLLENESGSRILKAGSKRTIHRLVVPVIIILVVSGALIVQHGNILSLRADNAKQVEEIDRLEKDLAQVTWTLQKTENSLAGAMAIITGTREALRNVTEALHVKESLYAGLSTQIKLLEAQIKALRQRPPSSEPILRVIISHRPVFNRTDVQTHIIEETTAKEETRTRPIPVFTPTNSDP